MLQYGTTKHQKRFQAKYQIIHSLSCVLQYICAIIRPSGSMKYPRPSGTMKYVYSANLAQPEWYPIITTWGNCVVVDCVVFWALKIQAKNSFLTTNWDWKAYLISLFILFIDFTHTQKKMFANWGTTIWKTQLQCFFKYFSVWLHCLYPVFVLF